MPEGMNFLVFGEPDREHDQQCCHENVSEVPRGWLRQNSGYNQRDSKRNRHDQGYLAFGLEEAHQPAHDEQHDVNPEDYFREIVHGERLPQLPLTSKLRISPGSHSTVTSNGRQQTSQSVVNRCDAMLVSTLISNACPQKGH